MSVTPDWAVTDYFQFSRDPRTQRYYFFSLMHGFATTLDTFLSKNKRRSIHSGGLSYTERLPVLKKFVRLLGHLKRRGKPFNRGDDTYFAPDTCPLCFGTHADGDYSAPIRSACLRRQS